MSALTKKALQIAAGYLGVREVSRNRGPEVDLFTSAVGLDPVKAPSWCYAFTWYCLNEAAKNLQVINPAPKAWGGAMRAWERTPDYYKSDVPTPGSIFIIDHGKGKGHAGFVEHPTALHVSTIEGNTNDAGGREGEGVYRHIRRVSDCVGFLDFGLQPPDLVA